MLNVTGPNSPWRALLPLATLSLLAGASCVPATHYERTKTALEAERAAGRQAQARIAELTQELEQARSQARAQEERVVEQEKKLAASNLDIELAASARDNALGMVDQLRGELSRAGDHLRAFEGEKQELSKALAERGPGADDRASQQNATLIRDLALAFHQQLAQGRYELSSNDGRPTLVVPLADGEQLEKTEQELASLLSQFMVLHPEARLGLSVTGANPASARARAEQLQKRLVQKGIPADRLTAVEGVYGEPGSGQKPNASVLKLRFSSQT